MSRISEAELQRIKRRPVAEVAAELGIVTKPRGKDLVAKCSLHDDEEPSMVLTPSKNVWHCFGCQAGGSVIDLVMRVRNLSFRHAVEVLRGEDELDLVLDDDQTLLHQVVGYYHRTLKESPEAIAYAKKRGLSKEAIEDFKIGYANRTLSYRLPAKTTKRGLELRARLQSLGVFRETGHEHLNGSLVVPVVVDGKVVQLYGRKIRDDLRKGTPKHLYLPRPFEGVFNREHLDSEKVIVCESLLDALTFYSAGIKSVTCAFGTCGMTKELRKFLEDKHTLIAFDNDDAGNKAAAKLLDELPRATHVELPKGMDVNEYALTMQPRERALRLLIDGETREPVIDEPRQEQPKPLVAESTQAVDEPTQDPDDLTFKFDTRSYRVRGLTKNTSFGQLKVNVFARRGEMFHTDTFDLYQARPRYAFIKHASIELEEDEQAIKRDLGKVLLKLETMQEDLVRGILEPKPYEMSPKEREQAMALLEDPRLIERILGDLERAGLIGEETNKLTAYLAVTSRKLKKPLAALVQSSSAAGKSSLMDAVLAFVPDEDKTKYSAITGQSLYYMKGSDLRHKVLAIAEEEGAERASYALKLLQSEGELCIASTGKDAVTGKLVTEEYKTEGPVMLFLTTTATNVDEELKNRCLVLAVSESREQTRRIHQLQRHRATLDGQLASLEKARIQLLHQNAQRLLEPLLIANPFAEKLTFHDHKTRTRRDHDKYLTLIASIALLHQHQRPVKEKRGHRYVEVRRSDIDLADKLLREVLGRSLDELPPQTRRVLELIEGYVAGKAEQTTSEARRSSATERDVRFTRRDLREATSLGDTQLKIHLARLVDLEYLVVEKRGRRYHYELVNSPATGRATVAHRSANGRGSANGKKANAANDLAANGRIVVENANGVSHNGHVVGEVHA